MQNELKKRFKLVNDWHDFCMGALISTVLFFSIEMAFGHWRSDVTWENRLIDNVEYVEATKKEVLARREKEKASGK